MACRIVITDNTGAPLLACDAHHGDDHAAAWVTGALAQLAVAGVEDCLAVEFDPVAGGDASRETIRALHEMRVELRTRPDGLREVIGVSAGTQHVARSVRVLHAPADVAGPRCTLRNKPGDLAERARRWKETCDPATARAATRRASPEPRA